MPRGEPQLEPSEPVVLPAESTAVPMQPEVVSPIAAPLGARGAEAAGMRDVMALSSPGERRKFILQLQRTAGNAAVCRWLNVVRDRYAALHGAGGPEDPADVDEPRAR
jgi:hypothetical protein